MSVTPSGKAEILKLRFGFVSEFLRVMQGCLLPQVDGGDITGWPFRMFCLVPFARS